VRNTLVLIRNSAFAVAIGIALSLGGAEALSGTPDATLVSNDCTFPDYCDDDDDCAIDGEICTFPPYYGGSCFMRLNCCICLE
jgi:hypothetical protein